MGTCVSFSVQCMSKHLEISMNLNFKHGASAAASTLCSQMLPLLHTLQTKLQLSPQLRLQTGAVDQPRNRQAGVQGQNRLECKLEMRLRRRTSVQVP